MLCNGRSLLLQQFDGNEFDPCHTKARRAPEEHEIDQDSGSLLIDKTGFARHQDSNLS